MLADKQKLDSGLLECNTQVATASACSLGHNAFSAASGSSAAFTFNIHEPIRAALAAATL